MITWVSENLGTILVAALLMAVVLAIVTGMIRGKKQGKSSCGRGCGCGACHMNESCHGACHSENRSVKQYHTGMYKRSLN